MITLKSSFEEIFGKDAKEYPEEIRKQRWQQWKQAAIKAKKQSTIDYWTSDETCHDCQHFDSKEGWCNAVGLPNTVNPILSFSMGVIGMACMGLGHERKNPQLELFNL